MACDTATLLDDARCMQCAVPPGLVGYVALALMCAIRDQETMSCDPATLLEEARCLQCAIPQGMLGFVQLTVLCDIASGGSGGNTGQVMQYTGADPNSDGILPTDQNQPAIAYRDDGSLPTFSWNTTLHIWQ